MSNLNSSLSTALSALAVNQSLIEISGNNMANLDNPDYARQQAQVVEQDPVLFGNLSFGSGVRLAGIQGIRDAALNLRIAAETSYHSGTGAYLSALQQIERGFATNNTNGISAKLDNFWSSWQQLSADPSNNSLRQQVLSAGGGLANALQQGSKQISDLRSNLDLSVEDGVSQVNTLLQTIAKLNASAAQSGGASPSLADQQDSAIAKLSSLIDVSVIRSNGTLQVTTPAGEPLVIDGQAATLRLNVNGVADQLLLNGSDITAQIANGKIGGALRARDSDLPALQNRLDVLAGSLVSAVNTSYGANFFVPLTQVSGAASAISVALTDPTQLQTGASGDAGDNSIVNAVAALQSSPIVGGVSASEYQAQTVFQLGNTIANSQAEGDASKAVISQMQEQRAAISGVSLDQEAANITQYQRSYQAAARVISTIDDLLKTAINLGANGQ